MYFLNSITARIHKLLPESECLLKPMLTFFINSSIIKENLQNFVTIEYFKSIINCLLKNSFGDETTAFLLNLTENERSL